MVPALKEGQWNSSRIIAKEPLLVLWSGSKGASARVRQPSYALLVGENRSSFVTVSPVMKKKIRGLKRVVVLVHYLKRSSSGAPLIMLVFDRRHAGYSAPWRQYESLLGKKHHHRWLDYSRRVRRPITDDGSSADGHK